MMDDACPPSGAHLIVLANEKGGTGKSTTAVHLAIALVAQGRRVGLLDLDHRQRTMTRYMENRRDTARRRGVDLAMPDFILFDGSDQGVLDAELARLADKDVIIVDTPGRDDPFTRHLAARADTLLTPVNDSFVDLDLIGQADATSFRLRSLSFYAEVIFDARKARAKREGRSIDWVVLRNRLQHFDARNKKRVAAALSELSRRAGFRVIPGLSDRVIFRELFPAGLTLLDRGQLAEVSLGHVAARQEIRELLAGLRLPAAAGFQPKAGSAMPAP